MKRKVIQIAGSTQLISLPRKWAIKNNIQKGDELDIQEEGDNLIVGSDNDETSETVHLDLRGLNDKFIRWIIHAAYKRGYDQIELVFDDPDTIRVIQDVIKGTIIGFEIIDQSAKRCTLKNISKGLEGEFDSILRRLFLVTISIAKTTLDGIANKDTTLLKDVVIQEETNNKLSNFCGRILNRKGYHDYKKTIFVYLIVWQLESIADEFRDIAKLLLKLDDPFKIKKSTSDIFKDAISLNEMFFALFYKFDKDKLSEIGDLREKITHAIKENHTETGLDRRVQLRLLNVSTRINDVLNSCSAINMDKMTIKNL